VSDVRSYVRPTHEVTKPPPTLAEHKAYRIDLPLKAAAEQAVLANRHEPRLRSHDRHGHRIDEVEFHPAHDPRCIEASQKAHAAQLIERALPC
jgi:hypothetical protein